MLWRNIRCNKYFLIFCRQRRIRTEGSFCFGALNGMIMNPGQQQLRKTCSDQRTEHIALRIEWIALRGQKRIRIAVVDNHRVFAETLAARLSAEPDLAVIGTAARAASIESC